MFEKILTALVGSKLERDLRKLNPILNSINEKEAWAQELSAEEYPKQTEKFKERIAQGESLDRILPEAFALAREAARRTLGERPYDVQILGAIVLHQGKIMELKTGEGKTLSSVAAAYLNALSGKGVHVITVNDYLAERDANWMKPVYDYLGITVGVILSQMDPERRKIEYSRDIVFGTNNEFGFDYLRDNMRWDINLKAQKQHHYCIIDEIDSILIDEARTPLIISGSVKEDTSKYKEANSVIAGLVECEKDPATGEYPLEDPISGIQPKGDYKLDEKNKGSSFTDEGLNHLEQLLQEKRIIKGSLFDEENFEFIHHCTQALRAHKLYHNDVDYVIQEGQVQIVDEFTGRILHGRRYSDGLHQAIEAKERIKVANRNRTLATITFQNYFRMYDKISGMTGTADTESKEFAKIYNLDVIVVPTNRPVNRVDDDDIIYLNEKFKFEAIAETVSEIQAKGQPVLIGTVSVESSEKLAKFLTKKGVRHEILNAKNHSREALIIAEAGAKGSVTIATNMAGRGTDIKLGGNPEFRARRRAGTDATEEEYAKAYEIEYKQWLKDNEEVKQLGGLYVLGSERHESRRIDNQLRGRSGRQGDPGYSRFFISLDDNLMRLFGGDRFKQTLSRLGMSGGEPIYHPLINKSLERAQKRVEDRNYEIRKHLLEYDDVLNKQRNVIYKKRDEILQCPDLAEKILETGLEIGEILVSDYETDLRKNDESYSFSRLYERLRQNFLYEDEKELENASAPEIRQMVLDYLKRDIGAKKELAGIEVLNSFIAENYLRQIDARWQDHLEQLESLREAVALRSYAQKNPLIEYKNEGFAIFDQMMEELEIAITRMVFRVRIRKENRDRRMTNENMGEAQHNAVNAFSGGGRPKSAQRAPEGSNPQQMQVVRTAPKVGRNDPCPCGSGKKYKACCGR